MLRKGTSGVERKQREKEREEKLRETVHEREKGRKGRRKGRREKKIEDEGRRQLYGRRLEAGGACLFCRNQGGRARTECVRSRSEGKDGEGGGGKRSGEGKGYKAGRTGVASHPATA